MTNWKIGDDILDSRDVEERIDELEALESEYLELLDEYMETTAMAVASMKAEEETGFWPEDRHQLKALRDFRSELEGYCDWTSGEVLIEESYRQTYAEQMAEEIGAIDKDANWPLRHIDWEAATNELFAHDYHHADVEGYTYYARMC